MMSIRVVIATAFLGLTLGNVANAQGRHDEKPHAVMKPMPDSEKATRQSGTGGRHDEGPTSHGKKRPAKKKASDAQKSTDSTSDAAPAK